MVSRDWPPQNTYERIVGWPSRFCPARTLGRWASNQQHWRNPPLIVKGEISRAGPGGWVPTHCIQDNTALKVPTDRPLAFKETADGTHIEVRIGKQEPSSGRFGSPVPGVMRRRSDRPRRCKRQSPRSSDFFIASATCRPVQGGPSELNG